MMAPRVIVFDVVETLLDTASLDPLFEEIYGGKAVRRQWFGDVLRSVFILTLTGRYEDFTAICRASLDTVAQQAGVAPADRQKEKIIGAMQSMRPHPDVHEGLTRLRKAGFRLAALTNSLPDAARAALDHAGLSQAFEEIMSADAVRRMKPAPEPYHMAAERLGIPIHRLRMVAAHDWDVAGALGAGCAAAFIGRSGNRPHPLAPQPDVVASDLKMTARMIIERESAPA